MLQAVPSKTHMAIVELSRRGILKYCISQNIDGLHRRSGLEPDKIAELHGNTNLEKCNQCKRQYFRDYKCKGDRYNGHKTGRKCECGGDLCDSIIHFGE
jgi:NAD-dependent histone deacetylase SIR2